MTDNEQLNQLFHLINNVLVSPNQQTSHAEGKTFYSLHGTDATCQNGKYSTPLNKFFVVDAFFTKKEFILPSLCGLIIRH
jgi:hypothetical protein